ncbi:hypothetical protein ANOM_010867 [Aspergillus nomiae NRRL 13137]|uniref:Uncharacterized protein n=1 Tax=Aspergillus nomiae NRRL (strain ATCC 15546 / NRRL 13137 / CBS 260.88 / M93) TaxID=1509407 RepID=A0A0L1INZ6_ASPN3|nr:uncharacterized protein ANOM_010867 [Aspergillus nomiae NRRL 13137]KNG81266.1 hypothetical protein ANOM_010867 [Aspergillus nomiae NRRL 13137]
MESVSIFRFDFLLGVFSWEFESIQKTTYLFCRTSPITPPEAGPEFLCRSGLISGSMASGLLEMLFLPLPLSIVSIPSRPTGLMVSVTAVYCTGK